MLYGVWKNNIFYGMWSWGGPTVTEFWGPHGMEEGKGKRYLAPGRQYGNALLGFRHQVVVVVACGDF